MPGSWSRNRSTKPGPSCFPVFRLMEVVSPGASGSPAPTCSTRCAGGTYIIHTADFVETPAPHVANIRDYRPAGDAFYEASCFTPDSKSLLMTSDCDTHTFWQNQIYRFDLETQQLDRLTHDTSYNEHPQVTPDGRSIIWMSDAHSDALRGAHGTDWWMMDTDGGNPRRISRMNVRNNPQCDGKPKWVGTAAFSPDGKWFYGDVQTNLITQAGKVVRVDLP